MFELFTEEATNLSSRSLRQDFTSFPHPFVCRQHGKNPDFNTLVFGVKDRLVLQSLDGLSTLDADRARFLPGNHLIYFYRNRFSFDHSQPNYEQN
jgi:hypothetical protein